MVPLYSQRFVHYSNLSSCAKRRKQDPKANEAGRRWCHLETTAQTDQNITKMVPLSSQQFVHYSNLSLCAKRRKQDTKVNEAGRRWWHLETTAQTDQNITSLLDAPSI